MLPEDYLLLRQLLVVNSDPVAIIEDLIRELYKRKRLTRTQYDELKRIVEAKFK